MIPFVLDLFSGQGGASLGYLVAGLRPFGVDNDPDTLKYYPFDRECSDWKASVEVSGPKASFVHASPPCQAYSKMKADGMTTARYGASSAAKIQHPDLIAPVRDALLKLGKPFVIENVPQAPLVDPVELCGCMFGLTTVVTPQRPSGKPYIRRAEGPCPDYCAGDEPLGKPVMMVLLRERHFECHGFEIKQPEHDMDLHKLKSFPIVNGVPTDYWHKFGHSQPSREDKVRAMGTPWMTLHGVAESIPPVFTEYIYSEYVRTRQSVS